jgi:hypothetical protein
MRAQRWLNLIACTFCTFGASIAWTPAGRADDESKRICASAFASAQRLMRTGNLLEARTKLILCGGRDCPTVMHPDCQQWLSGVEASIATVVFEVSSAEGPPPEEVRIAVDGGASIVLEGRAVGFDPGAHEIMFVASGFQTTTKRIVVSEGEKLRREGVTLYLSPVARRHEIRAVPADVAPLRRGAVGDRATRLTTPVILTASVAVVAGIGAVYLGMKARSDDRNLNVCAPSSSCARETTNRIGREYLWTNLSIGLAAASATTAVVLFLIHGRSAGRPAANLSVSLGPNGFGPAAIGTF